MKSVFDIISQPGDIDELLTDIPLYQYLAGREMSGSSLLKESMKHVRHHYETTSESTDAMRKGSGADALLFDYLIPARQEGRSLTDALAEFDEAWPVWDGSRRGKGWDEFYADHGENYLLLTAANDERTDIVGMLNAVVTDSVASACWESGVSQVVMKVSENGMRFKGRLDWLTRNAIIDLKTTARFESRQLSRTTFSYGYNIKMALYRRWHSRLTGCPPLPCYLVYVESKAPYDVAVMPIDSIVLDLAEEKATDKIAELKMAFDTNKWPGVAGGQEMPLEVPSYEMEEPEWQNVEG